MTGLRCKYVPCRGDYICSAHWQLSDMFPASLTSPEILHRTLYYKGRVTLSFQPPERCKLNFISET